MKRAVKVTASLVCLFLMLNMITIEADNNSLVIIADLRVYDNKNTAYLGEEILFDASLTQGPWQSLVFYFHDGTDPLVTSQTQVSHRFNIEGKFLVTLMAVGVGSTSDSATIEITIINEQPSAGILMPIAATEDEIVTLRAINIQDTPNDIDQLRYRWVLGDGNIKEGVEIEHAWTASGTYMVTLQVLDEHLAMNYATAEITITNTPPIANFDILNSDDNYVTPEGDAFIVTEEDLLDFDATSTEDSVSDYETLQFYWDFGDGSVGRGAKLHHTYHESGIYNVKLLVLDDDGASSSTNQLVVVQNLAPTISLMADNVLLQEGQTYLFETDSQDTITDFQNLLYSWSFGGTGSRQSHVWSDDWSGQVNVQVQDSEGLVAPDSINVQVQNVPPQASISMAYLEGDLSLKAAGTPGNTIELRLYGNNEILYNLSLDRIPGDPKSQEKSLHFIMDLSKTWHIEISYATAKEGANPTWLTFNNGDHSSYSSFHNFVVTRPETWVWTLYPKTSLSNWPITLNGTIYDPGSDSISAEFRLNSIPILNLVHQADGTWPVELPFEVTVQPSTTSVLEMTAADDDGGSTSTSINILKLGGSPYIQNSAPRFEFSFPENIYEDMPTTFVSHYQGPYPLESLQYNWKFGDGTSSDEPIPSHSFSNSGEYLIQLTITDPAGLYTTHGGIIQVKNYVPNVNILGVTTGTEDNPLKFTAQVDDTTSDINELRYFWTFGDGNVGIGPETSCSYAQSGVYTLELIVRDDNGAFGTRSIEISINDEPPIVDGPFGFTINEGYTLIANPRVYDSIVDEPNLIFQWFYGGRTSNSRIFSTSEDDGTYNAILTISDSGENSKTIDNITFTFINQPPVITASNLMLYGAPGTLMLKAFALDSYSDTPELTYKWFIDGETIPDGEGLSSQVTFVVTETRTYNGFVTVRDKSNYAVSSEFAVIGVLDTDGDGLTNEIEEIYNTNPNTTDSDGDYLPDSYEIEHTKTNPNAWDSDNDGFCDGLDPTPGIMTGETIFGTDPLNPDTDGDGLQDGEEIIGWTIQVREWIDGWDPEDPDQTKPRHVQSNPLLIDTDRDGLPDAQEVSLGLDPERPDTDGDGETDPEEIHQGATFDSDKDGLSDTLEETPIIIHVPMEYPFTLNAESTTFSSLSEALELKGTLEDTLTDDEHSWVGQIIAETSSQIITFTGVFKSITTQYNTFLVHLNVTADVEPVASFQLLDGSTWKTLTTFDTTTTDYVRFITDETNATRWIQSGTLRFRIISGYNELQEDENLYFVSYIEIIFAQMVGIMKYTLNPAVCSWTNTQGIEGNRANTRTDDIASWMGWKTVSGSSQQIRFEGGFNGITTDNNRLTVRLRVSADYTNAYFQIWDGQTWVTYRTFTESTTEYIVIQIDATNNPTWIQAGALRFRMISGCDRRTFNSQSEYQSYIEIFYAAIEEITTEETTLSDSSLPDTDKDGLSDWEEYYPGADGFVTNPRNNDTDADGLIDSAESVSLTREYGKRERFTRTKSISDRWVYWPGGKYTISTSQQFHFNAIINGGTAKNATVFVGFSSTTDLQINLVKIEVAGKTVVAEQNPTLEEPEGGLDGTYFFKGYDITTKTTAFSGEWRLTIDAKPLHPEDFSLGDEYSVLLEEFKADVVLPLNPIKADWDKDGLLDGTEMNAPITGWITNPRAWDSDGDSLSDREEIFKLHTNPLSVDTDGDGATDRLDRDPLFNLIIKIRVLQAHDVGAVFTPLLAVVMKVGDKAIATRPVWASKDGHQVWWWWAERTSVFNWDYYFDVPDDQPIARLGLEVWWINPVWWLWDSQLLSIGYDYAVGTGNDPKTTPDLKLYNAYGYWVQFRVSTLGLKRVNTIAVYAEGNFFNGHYPALERFVVITLGVLGNGGPFQNGVNTILIPVSLFTRTELHSKWENNRLPAALTEASASGIAAEFYGLDASAETISQHVEGLIEKGLKTGDTVTVAEALAILDSLLKNEIGDIIYAYFRCDMVGEVERLGLAKDILDLVADDAQALAMGPTGAQPKGFADWLISGFFFFVTLMVLAALSPFLLLGLLVTALIYIGIILIGPILAAVALILLKVIILVYLFIMLAITLLFILVGFLLVIFALSILALTSNPPSTLTVGFLWFELNYNEVNTRFEVSVVFKYTSFIDIDIPCLKIFYQNNLYPFEYLLTFGIPIDSEPVYSETSVEKLANILQTYNENTSVDNDGYLLGRGIALGMAFASILGLSLFPQGIWFDVYTIVLVIAPFVTGLAFFGSRPSVTAGLGLGIIHVGLMMLAPAITPGWVGDLFAAYFTEGLYRLFKSWFAPQYANDMAMDKTYSAVISSLSATSYNVLVEWNTNRLSHWLFVSIVFVIFGFTLAFIAAAAT